MTTFTPEDRERLRENAVEGGPWGAVVLALLDDLDEAEGRAERAEAELDRLHSWAGLMELLDERYPARLIPTAPDDPARDAGPRIVSLIRRVDEAEAAVQRVREMHEPVPVSECTTACSCGWWSHADCPHVQALDGGGES